MILVARAAAKLRLRWSTTVTAIAGERYLTYLYGGRAPVRGGGREKKEETVAEAGPGSELAVGATESTAGTSRVSVMSRALSGVSQLR